VLIVQWREGLGIQFVLLLARRIEGGIQVFAIIEVGGKQYKVEKEDIIDIERQDKQEGQDFILNKVLLVVKDKDIQLGQPYIKGVKVSATVLKNLKAPKVISYKYRRRKSSYWKKGHRQLLTRIRIKEIVC
jgi:large subunit ribosomal protein L21